MALTESLRHLARVRWEEWEHVLTLEEVVPILCIGTKPGSAPGIASYRFACAPEVRGALPNLLRQAADAISRQPLLGAGVILTPAAGSATEGGG